MTSILARLRLPLIIALGVALAVASLVLTRPDSFTARVSLLAVPVSQPSDQAAAAQYGSVVSLGLPAIAEVVRSPSVLQRAAPTASPTELARLADATTVELVPASGVVRISVADVEGLRAADLVRAIADGVVRADLLAPSARLRPLDPQPEVNDTAPSLALGIGLSVASGAAAGAVGYLLGRLRARRVKDETSVRSALAEVGQSATTPVLSSADPALIPRLAILQDAIAGPLRIVAVSISLTSRVMRIREGLRRFGVWIAGPGPDQGHRTGIVLAVDQLSTRSPEFQAIVQALPDRAAIVAIVLCKPSPSSHAADDHSSSSESTTITLDAGAM